MTEEQKKNYNALKKMINMKPQEDLPEPKVKRENTAKNYNYLNSIIYYNLNENKKVLRLSIVVQHLHKSRV